MPDSHQKLEYIEKITTFFTKIGINWRYGEITEESFLSGVKISEGTIVIDIGRLKHPGDLLHEAGHLAVEPQISRQKLDDNVRACGQGDIEEMAAIAWSWAALTAISIPPEVVFHPEGYRGHSQSLMGCFQRGEIWGQLHLEVWGLCKVFGDSHCFPKMHNWLRA